MWIDPDTMQVYRSDGEVRRARPNTSFALPITEAQASSVGLEKLHATQPPAYNPVFQSIAEGTPLFTGGRWEQQWVVMPLQTEEVEVKRQQARNNMWRRIQNLRDEKAQNGGFYANGKWFHSDRDSRIQQLGLTVAGNGIPPGLMWKTMDGSFIELNPGKVRALFEAAMQQDTAIFQHAEALKAAVDAADDPNSVDIEAGWPATYE